MYSFFKGLAFTSEYKRILDFCIYLKKKIAGDILVTTDVHDERCLLRE